MATDKVPILNIQMLSGLAFEPFGKILDDSEINDGFHILIEEANTTGWIMAVKQESSRTLDTIGYHPNSKEVFEPLQGLALIAVSKLDCPYDLTFFVLDRTICLNRNVWHGMLSITPSAKLRVFENAQVKGEVMKLNTSYRLGVITDENYEHSRDSGTCSTK